MRETPSSASLEFPTAGWPQVSARLFGLPGSPLWLDLCSSCSASVDSHSLEGIGLNSKVLHMWPSICSPQVVDLKPDHSSSLCSLSIHPPTHSHAQPYSFTRPTVYSPSYPSSYSFIYPYTHLSTHLSTHPFFPPAADPCVHPKFICVSYRHVMMLGTVHTQQAGRTS